MRLALGDREWLTQNIGVISHTRGDARCMRTTSGSARALWLMFGSALALGAPSRAYAEPHASDTPVAAEPPRESLLRGDARILGFVAAPFEGNQSGTALGFGLGVNVGLQRIPITLGVDLLTAFWGSQTSRLQVQAGNVFVPVDRTRDDHGYFLDFSVRAQPIAWFVRPYLEGVVGTKLLATTYSLSFPNSGTSTSKDTDHDWAGSIGWGAGLDLGNVHSLNVRVGFRRLHGAEASFSRTTRADDDVVVHYTTPTSCMIYMLGLSGTFGLARSADDARRE